MDGSALLMLQVIKSYVVSMKHNLQLLMSDVIVAFEDNRRLSVVRCIRDENSNV